MRRAITLFELLIVIAATLIFAWMLLPVFSLSKAASSDTDQIASIRQIATASLLYADDHDERYVPVGAPTADYTWSPARDPRFDAAGRPWNGWGLKLLGYAERPNVFRYPASDRYGSFSGACSHADGMDRSNSYSMNWLLGRDGSFTSPDDPGYTMTPSGVRLDRPTTVDAVHRPSNTIAFQISRYAVEQGSDRGCLRSTLKASDFDLRVVIPPVVDGGGNLAFADGHARWYKSFKADATRSDAHVYHWLSRNIWMQPTMPESTMGYTNSPGIR